ncbi:MAG: hypothetical protein WC052_04260 [Patescibacteria group bacterium]
MIKKRVDSLSDRQGGKRNVQLLRAYQLGFGIVALASAIVLVAEQFKKDAWFPLAFIVVSIFGIVRLQVIANRSRARRQTLAQKTIAK